MSSSSAVVDGIMSHPDAFARTCDSLSPLCLTEAHQQHVEALLRASPELLVLYTAMTTASPRLADRFWSAYFAFASGVEAARRRECPLTALSPVRPQALALRGAESPDAGWSNSLLSVDGSPVAAPHSMQSQPQKGSVSLSPSQGLSREPSTDLRHAFASLVEDGHEHQEEEGVTASLVRFLFTDVHSAIVTTLPSFSSSSNLDKNPTLELETRINGPRVVNVVTLREALFRGCCVADGPAAAIAHVLKRPGLDAPELRLHPSLTVDLRENEVNDLFASYW